MRSLTFDMIGMILMAVVVGLTTFGALTWAYFKSIQGTTGPEPEQPSSEHGDQSSLSAVAAAEGIESQEQPVLAGRR